ncbi:MAG: DUF192 domain-containing protein [Deltaproteobacteria bacterium]|nr:DUF192 domain-containing protein [Deltaproteobacteria bacterium]
MRAENVTRGRTLAGRVAVADRPAARLRGLIGRPPLQAGEGLLIEPCSGVHTFFMSFAIDVVFVGADGLVVAALGPLRPWRLTRIYPTATAALELPAGTVAATGTAAGDRIEFAAASRA